MSNTKLKDNAEETSFIDYGKLNKEIKRLEGDKRKVVSDIDAQSNKLSDLVKEEIAIKESNDKLIADAQDKANKIIGEAEVKRTNATKLDSDLKGKISQAETSKKDSDDLIKSNEGKTKNLTREKEIVAELKDRLNKCAEIIADMLR